MFMDYENDFCQCEHCSSIYTNFNDWYEWDVCSDCEKPIENSLRELNHYDGDDHVFYE